MKLIDINADLGEGGGFDAQLMPLISSCSIACGGHYGTDATMREAIHLAKKYDVKVGAHPAFPDKDGFGRRVLTLTKKELMAVLLDQLHNFYTICDAEGIVVHHVKLHGALYNYAAKDAPTSDAVVEAIIASERRPKLYVQQGSILHKKAENLLPLVFEAFIDRRYNSDLSLVDRSQLGAVISDPDLAWKQLLSMVSEAKVHTIDANEISIIAQTFCIHGDHEHSVPILNYIHQQLPRHSIKLR